jgi:hypothetical protein
VHKTIFEYENSKKGRGTEDFTALSRELLERLGERDANQRSVANA